MQSRVLAPCEVVRIAGPKAASRTRTPRAAHRTTQILIHIHTKHKGAKESQLAARIHDQDTLHWRHASCTPKKEKMWCHSSTGRRSMCVCVCGYVCVQEEEAMTALPFAHRGQCKAPFPGDNILYLGMGG